MTIGLLGPAQRMNEVQLRRETEFGSSHSKRKKKKKEAEVKLSVNSTGIKTETETVTSPDWKSNLHKFKCPPAEREIKLNIKVKEGEIIQTYCLSLQAALFFFFQFSVSFHLNIFTTEGLCLVPVCSFFLGTYSCDFYFYFFNHLFVGLREADLFTALLSVKLQTSSRTTSTPPPEVHL